MSDALFKAVYDTPASSPTRHRWPTRDEDVRKIEELVGMPLETIGAALWVNGDRKRCWNCQREINWLDIVSSALGVVHAPEMIVRVNPWRSKIRQHRSPARHRRLEMFPTQIRHRQLTQLQMSQLGTPSPRCSKCFNKWRNAPQPQNHLNTHFNKQPTKEIKMEFFVPQSNHSQPPKTRVGWRRVSQPAFSRRLTRYPLMPKGGSQ